MAAIKISEDLHQKLIEIQAGFRLRYKKAVHQIQILLQLRPHELDYDNDKIVDTLYKRIESQEPKKKPENLVIAD